MLRAAVRAASAARRSAPAGGAAGKRDPSVPAVHQEPQPPSDPWTPVRDEATGGTYYWNEATGETTAVGEPKPDGFYRQPQPQYAEYQPQSLGGQIGGMVLWGFGITIGFAIVGAAFRMLFG